MSAGAAAALEHALANQERLPYVERGFLLANHAWNLEDYDGTIDAYRQILQRYPSNIPALNNLSLVYQDTRQYPRAESLLTRAIGFDSTISTLYFGIQTAQVNQGRFAESRQTLDLIERRFPDERVLLAVEVQDAAAQQDWETAERRAEAYIAAEQGDTLVLVDAFEAMAGIVMTQGRLDQAERHWRSHLAMSAASGSRGRHLFGILQLAYLELRYRNAPARAVSLIDSALARTPLDSTLPGDRPYDQLARFFAKAGNLPRAHAYLIAADSNDRSLGRRRLADRSWTRGVIALAEGHPAQAEVELRHAADTHTCPICPQVDLSRAYEATGDPQAAITTLERYLSTPYLWRYETDAVELGWAMKRLGDLYEQQGQAQKAAAVRARLVRLWRRADPELQSVLAEVRGRIPN